jgi:hypothetical protein
VLLLGAGLEGGGECLSQVNGLVGDAIGVWIDLVLLVTWTTD